MRGATTFTITALDIMTPRTTTYVMLSVVFFSDRLSVINLSVVEPHVSEKNNMVSVNLLKLFFFVTECGAK